MGVRRQYTVNLVIWCVVCMDMDLELIHFKSAGPGTGQEMVGPTMAGSVGSTQLTGSLSLSVLTNIEFFYDHQLLQTTVFVAVAELN